MSFREKKFFFQLTNIKSKKKEKKERKTTTKRHSEFLIFESNKNFVIPQTLFNFFFSLSFSPSPIFVNSIHPFIQPPWVERVRIEKENVFFFLLNLFFIL